MWAKGAAVGNALRCPRLLPVRHRRIVHMSIACRARSARPRGPRLFAVGSCLRRQGRDPSEFPEDQVLCFLGAPSLDASLQRSQLRPACVRVKHDLGEAFHQFFGGHRRLIVQPSFDDRPGVREGILSSSPPALAGPLLSVRRTHLAILPCCCQAFEEHRHVRGSGRQAIPRSTCFNVAQNLLSCPNVAQQQHWVEAPELLLEL